MWVCPVRITVYPSRGLLRDEPCVPFKGDTVGAYSVTTRQECTGQPHDASHQVPTNGSSTEQPQCPLEVRHGGGWHDGQHHHHHGGASRCPSWESPRIG